MYYIMKAYHITETSRKVSLARMLAEVGAEESCTILIANRSYGYNKSAPCFIMGSGTGYPEEDETTYTIDTGNGHRNAGEALKILDRVVIENGEVVSGHTDHENAYPWVMK